MDGAISVVPSEARAYQGRTAGLVTRLLANTIDALCVVAECALSSSPRGEYHQKRNDDDDQRRYGDECNDDKEVHAESMSVRADRT